MKQNIKTLEGGLSIVEKVRPTVAEYNGKQGTPKGVKVYSVVAEEIEQILPSTVSRTRSSTGEMLVTFNPQELFFQAILAIQQLNERLTKAGI